jgi:hypothetical protein
LSLKSAPRLLNDALPRHLLGQATSVCDEMRTVAGMLGVMGLLSPMAMCQAFLVPAAIRAR